MVSTASALNTVKKVEALAGHLRSALSLVLCSPRYLWVLGQPWPRRPPHLHCRHRCPLPVSCWAPRLCLLFTSRHSTCSCDQRQGIQLSVRATVLPRTRVQTLPSVSFCEEPQGAACLSGHCGPPGPERPLPTGVKVKQADGFVAGGRGALRKCLHTCSSGDSEARPTERKCTGCLQVPTGIKPCASAVVRVRGERGPRSWDSVFLIWSFKLGDARKLLWMD